MYAIVDIETTGGHAAANGITEVAIYVHDGSKIVEEFHSLINPGVKIPAHITALTGISNAMVASAPSFNEVAGEIHRLLSGKVFVAHNVNFDYSFLFHFLKMEGLEWQAKKLCTVRLSRKVFPGCASYSLGNLCRNLQIPIQNRHRAGGDARATVILFEKILAHGEEHIYTMLKRSAGQWMPVHLDKQVIESLPSTPGVYYFHDQKGKVIYVGKAINVKKRVKGHFVSNNAGQRRQHFLRLVHNITCTPCASELHALVYESTQIKKLWPKYNTSQKQPVVQYALYSFEDGRGFMRIAIDRKRKNVPSLCSFNHLNEGLLLLNKLIGEFGLHPKLCYLDKTPLTVVDYEGLIPQLYNQRVEDALASLNASLPTYAIVEQGEAESGRLCLLIEKGSFWGMGYLRHEPGTDDLETIKGHLERYADNEYIRNSIRQYAEENPANKILFE